MSREVLAPPLQSMSSNRCYRINIIHTDFGGNKFNMQQAGTQKSNPYIEQDLYTLDDDDVGMEDEGAIEETANSTFKLDFPLANAFYGGLIGFKGSTKRRIETETQTEIFVPRHNDKSGKIVIKSKQRSQICAAARKIRLLTDSLRKRMRPTHFVAIAFNTGEVKQKFVELKEKILSSELPGIEESLFISELCIHVTLTVCVLLDEVERAKGVKLLQECRKFLTGLTTPFEVKVEGLEIMNDDPSATRVLYARCECADLQKFTNEMSKHYYNSGLSNENKDNVKLHMTVMNNRYRKDANPAAGNNFDAREILKRFGDYKFGVVKCNEAHLCVLKSSREVEDFYRITGTLNF